MGDTTIQGTDKIRNVPSGILMGRTTTGIGRGENLSSATVRSLLSVYQRTEVDGLLAGKSPIGHQHAISDVSGLSAALSAKADLIGGLVPASQLPSYVDDVLEFASLAAFPVSGESGKIYVALDTSRTYRWGGTAYVELTDATAVWGSISGTLANQTDLQTALNAKANVSHNQAWGTITGTPTTLAGYGITDGITASAVAAGYQPLDADLTAIAALSTAAFGRSLLTQADAGAVRTVIGAGTSSFDGAFSSLTGRPTTLAGYGITDAAAASHTHGNLTSAGAIGSTAGLPIITGASGVLQAGAFGNTSGTFCQGNDARLSDARTPLSHTHLQSEVTGLTAALVAKADLVGGLVPANQLPSFVDDVLEYANLAAFPATGESGKIYVALDTSRTYRWGGSTYVELTDSTAVWGSISGVLTNQTDLASALAGKSNTGHQHAASDITSGTIATARLASGTASASTYLRGDQTWATIAGGGISTLNTLTDATQTFQTGTTGTDFSIVSATGVHTFNLPDASATARGVIATGAQTIAGQKVIAAQNAAHVGLAVQAAASPTAYLQEWRQSTGAVIGYVEQFTSGSVRSRVSFDTYRMSGNGSASTGCLYGGPAALFFISNATRMMYYGQGGNLVLFNNYAPGLISVGGIGLTNNQSTMAIEGQWILDASNHIVQRNGTNQQQWSLANTWTSTTSLEYFNIAWTTVASAPVVTLQTIAGSGGGVVRGMRFGASSAQPMGFWGASPISQPTAAGTTPATITSPGAGNVVKTDDEFDGWTIAKLFRAIRNTGLLN